MDREEADRREAGREGMNGPAPADAARPELADAIRLDAVVRTQGSFTLGPLDMTVPVGMVTGFVGPNGAGKTTTIKAMLGMVGIDAGSIGVLDGAPGARRDRIGVVLDTVALPREWTAASAARTLEGFYPAGTGAGSMSFWPGWTCRPGSR